ncbi:hypothetical protein [Weissella coleopterorum]|uniref:hypothetical protein n=1 Tax=Weissella coleopterorum TaxID=2714949 RepID=UPI001FE67553|nr:hypothetical protein [Weissella coleopterorum]
MNHKIGWVLVYIALGLFLIFMVSNFKDTNFRQTKRTSENNLRTEQKKANQMAKAVPGALIKAVNQHNLE